MICILVKLCPYKMILCLKCINILSSLNADYRKQLRRQDNERLAVASINGYQCYRDVVSYIENEIIDERKT